jgi:hypothetical protein
MANDSNRYCRRLRIPVPDLDVVATCPEASLFHLMVAALLERGGPMTFDEIAARLERMALPPRLARTDIRAALRKAWHGQPPVVHDTDSRLALDLLFDEWWYLLARMEPERRPLAPSTTPFTPPPDEQPLSNEEVEAAFRDRGHDAVSDMRRAAAILEAAGQPLRLDAINARLGELSRHAYAIREEKVASWRSDLVMADSAGALRINQASSEIPAFRRAIRKMAEATLRRKAESEAHEKYWDESPARIERDEQHRQEEEEARTTRRALLHVAPGMDGGVLAAALVDAQARTVATYPAADALRAVLVGYDLIAGVDLRASLRALGLDPERWWLSELRPTGRTHRPDDGKAVPVTLGGCIRATTGARRSLSDAVEWARLAATPGRARLHARLEEEARTLFAFYQYGALHGGVRVRRRAQDTHLLPVSWSRAGDARLHAIVNAAERWWSPVDVVLDAPPSLDGFWMRARRADIVEDYWPVLYIREGDAVRSISAHDIFAIRILDARAAQAAQPGLGLHWDRRACQIKVTLDEIEPPIWRRVVVSASDTLEHLHAVLQAALGWTNSHLHVFEIEGERIGIPYDREYLDETYTRSSRIIHVGDLVDRGVRRFVYEYDFGDGWSHTVEIETVHTGDAGDTPRCVAGARACPPEDCGGVGGYERLLEILFNPRHREFETMRQWAGPNFQPERFDLREVNDRLAAVGWRGYELGFPP